MRVRYNTECDAPPSHLRIYSCAFVVLFCASPGGAYKTVTFVTFVIFRIVI
jgi:hypothetical protein